MTVDSQASEVADLEQPDRTPAVPHPNSGWRLLHVENDSVDALKLKLALRYELPLGSTLDHVYDLDEARQRVLQSTYDAAVVSHSFADPDSDDALRQLIQNASGTPVVILSDDSHARAALEAGRCGAREFIPKSKLTGELLGQRLRQIIAQHDDGQATAPSERRNAPRYDVIAPAVIVPILPDGRPGLDVPASVISLSQLGIGVLAQTDSETIPNLCVIGVAGRDETYRYATVEWRDRRLALPAIQFGGRFVTAADDPFHESRLTPRFNADRLRFQPAMDATLLQEWSSRGILSPQVVDRIKVCDACRSLLTFRDGCPQCGSADTAVSQLIHHFACAHVAPLVEFECGGLTCPKCQAKNLVVGADFEYLAGPHRCRECQWTDAAPELIAECLQCGRRFGADQAIESEVLAYHVDRLDPLALIENVR